MKKGKSKITTDFVRKVFVLTLWLGLIVFFLINKERVTFDALVNFTPSNTYVAILVMLFLFMFKSMVIFFYGGILYAVSGVIFPLPLAIAVNIAGTVIMCSVPYFIGYKSGSKLLDKLCLKYNKIQLIKEVQQNNEFVVSFFVRIVGILPADIVSMYLGASKTQFDTYIFGTLLGLLPSIISFSVMGMSAEDITSPAFIISAVFELCLMLFSIMFLYFWKRRKNKLNNRR